MGQTRSGEIYCLKSHVCSYREGARLYVTLSPAIFAHHSNHTITTLQKHAQQIILLKDNAALIYELVKTAEPEVKEESWRRSFK